MKLKLLGAALLASGLLISTQAHAHAAGASAPRAAAPATAPAATPAARTITEAQVLAAQKAWGRALVQISSDFASGGLARATATASAVLDAAYGYQMGPVLFKPTLTVTPHTFRTTRAGALAYFVGGDSNFPQDNGFALKGWTACNANKAATFIAGNAASWMGNIMLTGANGAVTTVDKTWMFVRDPQGQLRIAVHHSSLPFRAN